MKNENGPIHVAFHNKAKDIFFRTLQEFESQAKKLNRKTEEYRFRQLNEKHVNTLKQQLEIAAKALIEYY